MKISELGEFGLIELVRRWTASLPVPESLVLGIGDDAAAWRTEGQVLLATTDTLVEGVHFLPGPSEDLGWKAMASSLSDLAAMGGQPQLALVSLALPASTEVDWVESLYKGLLAAAGEYGVALGGGDTVAAPQAVVTVFLLGLAPEGRFMRRSAAQPGDLLAVTGHLGNAAGGLKVLQGRANLPESISTFLLAAHLRPRPRVAEGQALLSLGVRAAIDISDGLLADLGHLCRESGMAATLEAARMPIHPYLREAFPQECLQMAAGGGEDYELLFAAPAGVVERARESLAIPVTVVGKVESGHYGRVVLLGEDGLPQEMAEGGWQHFREVH